MRFTTSALAVLCVVVAGCGGADASHQPAPAPSPVQLLKRAVDQTVASGGAAVIRRVRAEDGSVHVISRGRMRLDLEAAHVMEAIRRSPKSDPPGPYESIYMRGGVYVRQPDTARWVDTVGSFGLQDTVAFLPSGATGLRQVGEPRLGKLATTRLDGVYDLRRVVHSSRDTARLFSPDYLDKLETPRMPFSVWIDRHRRIRQLRLEGDLTYLLGYYGGRRGTLMSQFEDFDADLSIDPPPRRLIDNAPRAQPEA
jgi:hypothetical protein